MDAAWPASNGEAIHTSTFLGHPVGCAMALAQIREIERLRLVERSARLGPRFLDLLGEAVREACGKARIRGLGLLAGVEFLNRNGSPASAATIDLIKRMLRRGFVLLPEGEHGNVLSFTPPLTISVRHLRRTAESLGQELVSQAANELA
jgi:4-aminobutyrate aminotransferase-like enzyme